MDKNKFGYNLFIVQDELVNKKFYEMNQLIF